jgi:hypothetical protein
VTSVQTAHVVPVRQCGKGGTPYLAWINPFLTTRRGVATTNRLNKAGVAAYAARCYSLSRRTTVGDPELKSGQRVWVADWRVPGRRRYGRTVRVDSSEDPFRGEGVTIPPEAKPVVISRTLDRRGVERDVAEELD